MTLLKTADGRTQEQCDGCGRVQDDANASFVVKTYAVHDSNVGGKVQHHYCTHCAANRQASLEILNVPQPPNQFARSSDPVDQMADRLPASVEEALAAAEEIEGDKSE